MKSVSLTHLLLVPQRLHVSDHRSFAAGFYRAVFGVFQMLPKHRIFQRTNQSLLQLSITNGTKYGPKHVSTRHQEIQQSVKTPYEPHLARQRSTVNVDKWYCPIQATAETVQCCRVKSTGCATAELWLTVPAVTERTQEGQWSLRARRPCRCGQAAVCDPSQ